MQGFVEASHVPIPSRAESVCLFLDIDGTLLDLAPKPADVVVPPTLVRDLCAADGLLRGALALISGRTIEDVDRLFQPLRLRATGVHGAEMRLASDGPILRNAEAALPAQDWLALEHLAAGFPGTFAENKRYAFAVHYRSAPQIAGRLEAAVRDYLGERPHLALLPGHCVFEIKRALDDKGKAVARFMRQPPFAGRRPIFIGDDTTDVPGFAAALDHDGSAYSVGRRIDGLTGAFSQPAAVREWLAEFVGSRQRVEE